MAKPYVIGIDLGGTNTAFGVVDKEGKVIASTSIKTQAYPDLNDYMKALSDAMKKLAKDSVGLDKINGIGVGAPNGNFYTGNIEHAANLPWKGIVPFSRMLSEKMGLPVSLTNDANAAAVGEATYGAARNMKDFIMITLGTGVGSGIYVGGKLVYGADGNAGELGHVIVRRNGRQCGCGNKGCLECYTSATGIVRTAREFLLNDTQTPTMLREISEKEISGLYLTECARKGDKMCLDIFNYTGTILGEALADFVKFSSPEAIILFGGLAKAGTLLSIPTEKAMNDNLMPVFKNKVKLLFSELSGADAAILGASALAWEL
ncbi:MAG: ROK family protein [Paludibacteraceae bacterium]|nr:ROK family protein [Paludibacteraceae bacterium]